MLGIDPRNLRIDVNARGVAGARIPKRVSQIIGLNFEGSSGSGEGIHDMRNFDAPNLLGVVVEISMKVRKIDTPYVIQRTQS
jgi:hypothetical protein